MKREEVAAVEATGYGMSGYIGGLKKQTYWTPDGRKIEAFPNIRERVYKDKDGKVTSSVIVDANMDKGWLTQPPSRKQLFCPHCDGWHKTQAKVDECGVQQKARLSQFEDKAKTEMVKEQQDKELKISSLEDKVDKLTKLVEQLVASGGKSIG